MVAIRTGAEPHRVKVIRDASDPLAVGRGMLRALNSRPGRIAPHYKTQTASKQGMWNSSHMHHPLRALQNTNGVQARDRGRRSMVNKGCRPADLKRFVQDRRQVRAPPKADRLRPGTKAAWSVPESERAERCARFHGGFTEPVHNYKLARSYNALNNIGRMWEKVVLFW